MLVTQRQLRATASNASVSIREEFRTWNDAMAAVRKDQEFGIENHSPDNNLAVHIPDSKINLSDQRSIVWHNNFMSHATSIKINN